MGDDSIYCTVKNMEGETKSHTEFESGGGDSSESTISSSGGGSEKNLVPPSQKNRMEMGYGLPPALGYPEDDSISLHSAISPQVHRKLKPAFFMGPSSPALAHSNFLNQSRFSTPSSPALSIASRRNRGPTPLLTQAILTDMARSSYRSKNPDAFFDNFLQVPGTSTNHPLCIGDKMCASCQLKEDAMSTCSSIGPPPTFTAQDNYRPYGYKRKRRNCTCSVVFIATMVVAVLVLVLIGAFILYIEMVVRRTEYIPDPM